METDLSRLLGTLLQPGALQAGPAGLLVPTVGPQGSQGAAAPRTPPTAATFDIFPPAANGLFEVNPLGVAHPLVPVVVRFAKWFVQLANEENLFGYPIDATAIVPPIREYIVSGKKMEFAVTDTHADAVLMALIAIGRMIVFEPECDAFRDRVHDLFPLAPARVETVTRRQVEKEVGRLLGTQRAQRTTLILGVGRDPQTIQEALARGDHVVALDRDPKVIAWLREHFQGLDRGARRRLVLEEVPHHDTEFLLRYADQVDRCYAIYPNDPTTVVAVVNTLKPGGVLITQGMHDDGPNYADKVNAWLGKADEFVVRKKYEEATPAYKTPWSRICPSGNVINLIRRDPHSRMTGMLFLRVTDETLRAMDEGSNVLFSIGLPVETLALEEVMHLKLCRVEGGVLAPILEAHKRRRLEVERVPLLALAMEAGMLHSWLEEGEGVWPPSAAVVDRVIARLKTHLRDPDTEAITRFGWEAVLTEVVDATARQLATMEEAAFSVHEGWIVRHFPQVPELRRALQTPVDMQAVRAALAFPSGQDYSTTFLGPGLEEVGLIHDALLATGRNDRVYVVERNRKTLRQIEEGCSEFPRELRAKLVFVEADYGDLTSLERYRAVSDRVYVIYPNRFGDALRAADLLLKNGGRLVLQHVGGEPASHGPGETIREAVERLHAGYTKILALWNVRPILRTAQSQRFASGNLFLVMDKWTRPSREPGDPAGEP